MHHANFSFAVIALIALLTGCAGGRDAPHVVPDGGPRDMGPYTDAYVPPTDFGTPADLGPPDLGVPPDLGPRDMGVRCVSGCTSNAACQTSCPPNPTPANPVCCDIPSGTCFNATTSSCPSTTPTDAGTTTSS
jgi:hypothetical protein